MFILFIIAGMLLAFGIYLFISRIQFIKTAHITEATVIDRYIVKADPDSENTDILHLTFRMYNANNEEVIFKQEWSVTDSWQMGDKGMIAYKTRDPQFYDPHHVVFLNEGAFVPAMFIFSTALVLIIVAAGYYWAEYFFNSL